MERILILNGPNLNFLGIREPSLYGTETFDELCAAVEEKAKELGYETEFLQSNHEGDLIDALQEAQFNEEIKGCVLNGGGLSHYSVSLRDAAASVSFPVIDVHLTEPKTREDFRHADLLEDVCEARFAGEGKISYFKALEFLHKIIKKG